MQSTSDTKKRRACSPPADEAAAKKAKISDVNFVSQPIHTPEADGFNAGVSNKHVEPVVMTDDTGNDAPTETSENGKDKEGDIVMAEVESKPKATKNPPVKSCFEPWKPNITIPPKSDFWGIKPKTGDLRPHPDQPSARESNGATNPPMWEDRKFRFKRGSRNVKYFGPIEPPNSQALPDLDQEDLLAVQLIDMRIVGKKNPVPRRQPIVYFYEHGKPKDWDNMQAIKALNDRRGQSIDRITLDDPWTPTERQYLAALLVEFPDASIWELTERHNDRFMGQDFAPSTAFGFSELSQGRTVESVRHEYVTYKASYDNGEAPSRVRWRTDKSKEGKALHAAKKMVAIFGPPDKKLEEAFDAEEDASDGEGEDGAPTKAPAKKATSKKPSPQKRGAKKSEKVVDQPEDEGEHRNVPDALFTAQPKLDALDEELLELAGAYNPDEIRHSAPHYIPPRSPLSFTDSPLTDLGDWSPVPPEEEERMAESAIEQVVKEVVDELVDAAIEQTAVVGLGIDFSARNAVEVAAEVEVAQQTQIEQQGDMTNPAHTTIETAHTHVEVAAEVEVAQQTQVEEQGATTDPASTAIETAHTHVEVDVQVETAIQEAVVQETAIPEPVIQAPPPASHAPLHATRPIELDEEYDDDDEDEGFDSA
tara:strand:- start:5605 stop:7551 length:1947 start_codon:yes stop_codon:yes gene_type:complete